jgi:type IV secretory pathway protease TraF
MRINRYFKAPIAVLLAIWVANIGVIGLDIHAPQIVYNASGNAPFGLRYLDNRLPDRGEIAAVRRPPLLEG